MYAASAVMWKTGYKARLKRHLDKQITEGTLRHTRRCMNAWPTRYIYFCTGLDIEKDFFSGWAAITRSIQKGSLLLFDIKFLGGVIFRKRLFIRQDDFSRGG